MSLGSQSDGRTDVATELLRAPRRSGNHSITVFTRSPPPSEKVSGVSYLQVDYHDLPSLTEALRGFDTCLSFLIAHTDAGNTTQKNLIAACIAAGVRRFAPNEWAIANNSGVPTYANKDWIAKYLAELKGKEELGNLQYCLFQPSVFMDYFAHPQPLSPNLITWPFFVDFETRRAIVLDDGDQPLVVIAISDISEVLARALDDDRPWPVIGGMRGCQTSINEILAIGKRLRGGEWRVEHVKSVDIARRELKTSWVPQFSHPAIPEEAREKFSVEFLLDFLGAIANGSWDVSGEWNERFLDQEFVSLEGYLGKAWEGKA
jgi:hypothetical protein